MVEATSNRSQPPPAAPPNSPDALDSPESPDSRCCSIASSSAPPTYRPPPTIPPTYRAAPTVEPSSRCTSSNYKQSQRVGTASLKGMSSSSTLSPWASRLARVANVYAPVQPKSSRSWSAGASSDSTFPAQSGMQWPSSQYSEVMSGQSLYPARNLMIRQRQKGRHRTPPQLTSASAPHPRSAGKLLQLLNAAGFSGLKWVDHGRSRPTSGTELVHEGLRLALEKSKFEFTQDEFDRLSITPLRADSYVKLVDVAGEERFFKPARLALNKAATLKQTKFTARELRCAHATPRTLANGPCMN